MKKQMGYTVVELLMVIAFLAVICLFAGICYAVSNFLGKFW